MSKLTDKEMHELRALQHMADKGFAAWTNENFQDVLDTFDEVQRIRNAQSAHISEQGEVIEELREELSALADSKTQALYERTEKWRGLCKEWKEKFEAAEAQAAASQEQVDAKEGELKTYGYHTTHCEYNGTHEISCDCGWREVKAALGDGGERSEG